jgi:hypothetical protein
VTSRGEAAVVVGTAEPNSGKPGSAARRIAASTVIYAAAAAPFVFFLFFVIRGGWLAISIALSTFPSSLIRLCRYSLPEGAVVGAILGLMPDRWFFPARGGLAKQLGAAAPLLLPSQDRP